jgi:Flp pilus assembly pilin Flp
MERMRKLLKDQEGQAIVEYVLMLTAVISLVAMLGAGFRKTVFSFWKMVKVEVSAGCPSRACHINPQ